MSSNSYDAFCEICSLRFMKKSVLQTHCSIIHGKSILTLPLVALPEGNSFNCTICHSRFALKNHLQKHVALVHGQLEQCLNDPELVQAKRTAFMS